MRWKVKKILIKTVTDIISLVLLLATVTAVTLFFAGLFTLATKFLQQ